MTVERGDSVRTSVFGRPLSGTVERTYARESVWGRTEMVRVRFDGDKPKHACIAVRDLDLDIVDDGDDPAIPDGEPF